LVQGFNNQTLSEVYPVKEAVQKISGLKALTIRLYQNFIPSKKWFKGFF